MGIKRYISDWHYGHKNCLRFDNRPWVDIEQANQEMIRRWNETVEDDDTVYILGDMFWCGTEEAVKVLDQLKGQKVLVKGNHDRCHDNRFRSRFLELRDYMEIEDGSRHVVLCHYPIPCFRNHFYGWIHLYGHVHSSFEWNMMESVKHEMTALYDKRCQMYNVGAMMPYIDYIPRTLDEILEGANK